MCFKSISVIVTNEAVDGGALRAAAALREIHDGHLDVFCLGIDDSRIDAYAVGSAAVVAEVSRAEAEERAAAMLAWASDILGPDQHRITVRSAVVPRLGLAAYVADVTRFSDLVVSAKPYGENRGPRTVEVLEAVLFRSGAPVLVLPDRDDIDLAFRRVIVGWNESEEAYTTIRKVLPVLKRASLVDIVIVDPPAHAPDRSDPGGAVSLMLARHGVRCEVTILARGGERISDVLRRHARDRGADLIVMGAYGHSRFREAILGGATRNMLEATDVPLMMAH